MAQKMSGWVSQFATASLGLQKNKIRARVAKERIKGKEKEVPDQIERGLPKNCEYYRKFNARSYIFSATLWELFAHE